MPAIVMIQFTPAVVERFRILAQTMEETARRITELLADDPSWLGCDDDLDDLDETLTCCGHPFPTFAAWMAHWRTHPVRGLGL